MGASDAAVVHKFLDSIATLNVEGALSCLHPECVVEEPASLPYGGTHVGVPGFMTIFTKLTEVAAPTFESFEVLDAGTKVIGQVQLLLTAHVTGKEFRTSVTEVYTLTDGVITHADIFYKDTKALGDFLNGG